MSLQQPECEFCVTPEQSCVSCVMKDIIHVSKKTFLPLVLAKPVNTDKRINIASGEDVMLEEFA